MSSITADEKVARIVKALEKFVLIKREIDWLRRHEPIVYIEMLDKLKEAVTDGDSR